MATKRRKKNVNAKEGTEVRESDETVLVGPWDGSEDGKKKLLGSCKRVMTETARSLGLGKGGFDVSANPYGPVLGGGVRLDTDEFSLWVYFGRAGEEPTLVGRKVRHRRDYGYSDERPNVSFAWELLWDGKKLAEVLKLEGLVS